ncbi:MAG: glucosamine-6-phosphate deaminase [Verrucomicrobiota bacterium]
MQIHTFPDKASMGRAAAEAGAAVLKETPNARFIVATGASQFEMLDHLTTLDLPWSSMTGFHLDEYVGLPITHPASFRAYLWQRFVSQLPLPPQAFHFLNAETAPEAECARVGELLSVAPIDVAFVGIGENGHLAFNDPPADFETDRPYLVVGLDHACREQQVGEGWFPDLESVPDKAISMSIRQILKSRKIICTVPDARKAEAVRGAFEGTITPDVPASILQTHPDCELFLDEAAAKLLKQIR